MSRVVLIAVLVVPLFSNEMNMIEFRTHERFVTLNAFKELFKQRNLASHKRKLKAKYNRTKELHSNNIILNMKAMKLNPKVDTSEMLQVKAPSLQIESNNELIKESTELSRVDKIKENIVPNIDVPDVIDIEKTDTQDIITPHLDVVTDDIKSDDIITTEISDTGLVDEPKIEPVDDIVDESIEDNMIENEQTATTAEADIKFIKLRSLGANPWQRR